MDKCYTFIPRKIDTFYLTKEFVGVENIKDFKGLYNLKNIEGFESYSSFNGS